MHRDSRPAGRGPWGPGSPAGAAEMWGFAPGCVSFPQSLAQRQSDQPGPPQAPQLPAESCLSQASGKAAVGCPARDGGMKEGCPWSPRFLPQKCLLSGGREPWWPCPHVPACSDRACWSWGRPGRQALREGEGQRRSPTPHQETFSNSLDPWAEAAPGRVAGPSSM